jgi:hypothetical protein
MKTCAINQCDEMTTGYSKFCAKHKRTQRRHGDPEQSGVTVAELKPYLVRVQRRVLKNAENEAWGLLADRWEKLVAIAIDKQQIYKSGKPANKDDFHAFNEITKLSDIEPQKIIEVYIAMYLLMMEKPKRFQSDNAFLFQLARRIRGLTDVNAGQYWDNEKKQSKRVYRDLPPRVLKTFGNHLVETFGAAGLVVARLEADEINLIHQEQVKLENAFRALT